MATSSLSGLIIQNPTTAAATYRFNQIAVMTSGHNDDGVQNGGACCCFKPNSCTTYITFELWGAGGDGGGGCCCQGNYRSPNPGFYVKKTVSGSICPYYNVCSAGSGCCSCGCCGTCGFPSFVTNSAGSTIACAVGGSGGCTGCWHGIGCNPCTGICQYACNTLICCGPSAYDIAFQGTSLGQMDNYFCAQFTVQLVQGAIKYQPNARHSLDPCCTSMTIQGCCKFGSSGSQAIPWPGGPGNAGTGCGGGCCWGQWGSSGLVLITYG